MKLPLIQKIEIDSFDLESLSKIFKKNQVGQCPTLISMEVPEGSSWSECALAVEKTCQELKIDPRFPYPIYLLNPVSEATGDFFPTLASLSDAPAHFKKKIKRLKNREQVLLMKTITMSDRIKNHSVPETWKYLKDKSFVNKTLRNLCHEKAFYEDILKTLSSGSES